MPGAQNGQCAEQATQKPAAPSKGGASGNLDGGQPGRGASAFDSFIISHEAKYPKAVACLTRDRDALLAFHDFPAEHWVHIRTTNPIESTFATVRLRTAKTRGCVSRQNMLAMVFMLAKSAERGWRKLKGAGRLAELIAGIQFKNGLPENSKKIAA